jgi:hypothetical protein
VFICFVPLRLMCGCECAVCVVCAPSRGRCVCVYLWCVFAFDEWV